MEKFQKFPNTTGQFVKVQDHSKITSQSDKDDTMLDTALQNAVARVDYNGDPRALSFNASTYAQQVFVLGTDGNKYLIPAFALAKPKKPTVTVSNGSYVGNITENDMDGDGNIDTASGWTKTVTDKSQEQRIKITAISNGPGTVYFKRGKDGQETQMPSAGLYPEPSMRVHHETIDYIIYTKYAGEVSDNVYVKVKYDRKLAITFTYTPNRTNESGSIEHSPMYYSPSGMVIAHTNQMLGDDEGEVTWTNSQGRTFVRNNEAFGTDYMIFYQDTNGSDYWFEAKKSDWEPSVRTTGDDLRIRHLHIPTVFTKRPEPNINVLNGDTEGIYEPYKSLIVKDETGSKNANGDDVAVQVDYKITYANNILNPRSYNETEFGQITKTFTNEPISELSYTNHRYVCGDCSISGNVHANAETVENEGTFAWKGQTFILNGIQCRHLPKPNIAYNEVATPLVPDDSSGGWIYGYKFTMSKNSTAIKDEARQRVNDSILYNKDNNPYEVYSTDVVYSGDSYSAQTIAQNSIKAKVQADNWITSEETKSPNTNLTYDKPQVHYGVWKAQDLGITTSFGSISLTNDQIKSALTMTNNVSVYDITPGEKIVIANGAKASSYNLVWGYGQGPIVAFPASWGKVNIAGGNITNGTSGSYSDFNEATVELKGITYNVYYKTNIENPSPISGEPLCFILS
jgi:hypothetical protein